MPSCNILLNKLYPAVVSYIINVVVLNSYSILIKRPARDACLCMGELLAPPAPHFVFLITL